MSNEIIRPITTSNKLRPKLSQYDTKISLEFDGNYLKQDKVTFKHGTIVNIYIIYDLSSKFNDFDFALEDCLFGAVKLTKMLILISTNIQDMVWQFWSKCNNFWSLYEFFCTY